MKLNPKRIDGESQATYRARRKAENQRVDDYLRHGTLNNGAGHHRRADRKRLCLSPRQYRKFVKQQRRNVRMGAEP